MPYNVNPPCPVEQKTLIQWSFPYSSSGETLEGDDYITGRMPGQCWGEYRITMDAQLRVVHYVNNAIAASKDVPTRLTMTPPRTARIRNPWNPVYPAQLTSGLIAGLIAKYGYGWATASNPSGLGTTPFADYREAPWSPAGYVPGSESNIVITKINTGADDCGGYGIAIFKNKQIIIEENGRSFPANVNWECVTNQCPSNTCEVDCGNTICCYNSQGISVFSYDK
jgi:hypothetical protein